MGKNAASKIDRFCTIFCLLENCAKICLNPKFPKPKLFQSPNRNQNLNKSLWFHNTARERCHHYDRKPVLRIPTD
jgi:hypothetical protein